MAYPEKWNAIHRLVVITGRLVEVQGLLPDIINPFASSPLDKEYKEIIDIVKAYTNEIHDTNSLMAKYYRFNFEFTNHRGKPIQIYLHEQPQNKGAYFYEINAGNLATQANTRDSFKHMLEQMADSKYDFTTFPKPL
jgi:hypothetical protein